MSPKGRGAGKDERGSVSIAAAGVMVVALVLSLATVDIMRVLLAQSTTQAAADAAALAAAQEIALGAPVPPGDVAADYSQKNGAVLVSCACELGDGQAIVTVTSPAQLVFLGPSLDIRATARAVVDGATPGSAGPASPLPRGSLPGKMAPYG